MFQIFSALERLVEITGLVQFNAVIAALPEQQRIRYETLLVARETSIGGSQQLLRRQRTSAKQRELQGNHTLVELV